MSIPIGMDKKTKNRGQNQKNVKNPTQPENHCKNHCKNILKGPNHLRAESRLFQARGALPSLGFQALTALLGSCLQLLSQVLAFDLRAVTVRKIEM